MQRLLQLVEIAMEIDSSGKRERGPQKRAERTRRNVLEATLRLIARSGLGAVRFRAVSDEAGVSLGVITYHFPNRRDLLSAAFALHLEQSDEEASAFTELLGVAWKAGEVSLDDATDGVVRLLSSFVHDDRDSFIAGHELTLELTRDPSLVSSVQDSLSAHHRIVSALVEQVGSTVPEPDAEILSAAFQGLALKWLAHPDDPEFEERLRLVVRRMLEKFLGSF